MKRKITTIFVLTMLLLCLFAGCSSVSKVLSTTEYKLDTIEGDIVCEFRIGKDAEFSEEKVFTDTVFDKDEFVRLFNRRESYTGTHLQYNLDECTLKINPRDKPLELDKIDRSEINISIQGENVDEKKNSVSVYEYESKMYFFVLCMGSKSKDDQIGYYFMELPEDMQEYWRPIFEKVREDDKANKEKQLGSFTLERTYTHDNNYYADCRINDEGAVIIDIYKRYPRQPVSSFSPCGKEDFWGMSWEYDNYNIWIQCDDAGTVCYSCKDEKWELNSEAVKPGYLIERW